ncbi:MAG: flagellar biosynthetic protein FliQ [Alphaproteobacteria bacterium]|nr:flagellar biosynthetic protein FliQ [Futiania mangrovii]MDX5360531.1 flagellar biosynthetic protein FliQ [Alphaproteobacteria bacterium]MDX5368674.1 flagellar biosynthetic protein FliQ [Alphaproteobacteria bacterium]MDX5463419.1 flagellar biosynthetic protein FliQ [Alphaproteobacteria bacterium]
MEIIDALRAAIGLMLQLGWPAMLTALVVGVGIGLIQALTSIQEMTLTFVPKLLAVFAVIWATVDGGARVLVAFFRGPVINAILGI